MIAPPFTARCSIVQRAFKATTLAMCWRSGSGGASARSTRKRKVRAMRSEEHTSELQSLMRISYAVFCLKKKTTHDTHNADHPHENYNVTTYDSTSETHTPITSP